MVSTGVFFFVCVHCYIDNAVVLIFFSMRFTET